MRLLLDAHISGPVVGRALAGDGHDVRAIDSERELEGLSDPRLLELAISESRVLVSANEKDFVPLVKSLNEAGRSHSGCIMIPKSVRNEDFAAIISGVRELLEGTSQEQWVVTSCAGYGEVERRSRAFAEAGAGVDEPGGGLRMQRSEVGDGQQAHLLLRGESGHPGLRFRVVDAGGVGHQRTPFTGRMARAPAMENRAATK